MRVTLTASQTKVIDAINSGLVSNKEIAAAVGVAEPNSTLLTRKMSEMGMVENIAEGKFRPVLTVTELGVIARDSYIAIAKSMGGEPRITLTDKHILIMSAITDGNLTNRAIANQIEVPESNTILLLRKMNEMGLISDEYVVDDSDTFQRSREKRRSWSVTQLGMDVWGVVYRVGQHKDAEESRKQVG